MISEKDKNMILAYAKKYKLEKVIYPPPSNPRRPDTHRHRTRTKDEWSGEDTANSR
jgi:hypothetical protein